METISARNLEGTASNCRHAIQCRNGEKLYGIVNYCVW